MLLRHPNYYKELRKRALDERNRERVIICSAAPNPDQAISPMSDGSPRRRATGPGKLQAREDSTANSTRGRVAEPQASSAKLKDPQATSDKHQAPKHKRQA